MADHTKGLKEYAKQKTQITLDKVDAVIRELSYKKLKEQLEILRGKLYEKL